MQPWWRRHGLARRWHPALQRLYRIDDVGSRLVLAGLGTPGFSLHGGLVAIDDFAGLLALVQAGPLEIHPRGARAGCDLPSDAPSRYRRMMAQQPSWPDPAADDPEPPAGAAKYNDDRPPEPLDPAHRAAVMEGLGQMRRGETASDPAIAALYRRAGL